MTRGRAAAPRTPAPPGPAPAAPHQGAQPGVELLQGEGFDHVVVGACIQPQYPVVQGITGGQDEHGQGLPLPAQLAQQADAVDVRQVEIQDKGGKFLALERREGRHPLLEPVHRVAAAAQGINHAVSQHHIIFHQQDPHCSLPQRHCPPVCKLVGRVEIAHCAACVYSLARRSRISILRPSSATSRPGRAGAARALSR